MRDVNRIGAETFAAIVLGAPEAVVFDDDGRLHLRTASEGIRRLEP